MMRLARLVPRSGNYLTVLHRCRSTQVGVKQDPISSDNQDKSFTDKPKSEIAKATAAPEGPKKVSPAKLCFLGKFDTDIFTFPEILDKERSELLEDLVKPIDQFFHNQVDSKKIDQDAKIPEEVLQGLKELGLFGIQIPVEYGGLGLNATEFARVGEFVGDGSIYVTLAAHQSIGLKGLLLYGTPEQKEKYLPKLATGETVAAFCLTEAGSGSDAGSVQTKAELSQDGKTWYLTGSKIWISNGGIADFFTVFARTADDNVDPKNPKRLTAFAVERSFGGISNGKPEDKHGIRGSNTCEVHFDRTPVPAENVIGEVGGGFKVAVNILNSGRFSMGSASAAALRRAQALAVDHAINRKQFGRPLMEFGLIRDKIARLAIDTYVMESLSYLTAGLLDSNLYGDCAVEAAIVKVMSSEMAYRGMMEAMQIHGGMGYMKDQPFDVALRDCRILTIFEGTNEILRLFIALMGVQHAGKELREEVKKLRNPFMYPSLAIKKIFTRNRQHTDKPMAEHRLTLRQYLHPRLVEDADTLEHCISRLQYSVEIALERYGAKIVDQQRDLERLANMICDIYAMSAVLSRASRAYCIGLRNAEIDINIAQVFMLEASERVRQNYEGLKNPGNFLDPIRDIIAESSFQNRGYACEHPLKRTFW